MSGPRWSVTLFSFTNELLAADETPDDLLRRILRDGCDTVEIDAAQHFRSFPVLDAAEVAATAGLVRAAGAAVSILGGGADVFPGPGREADDATVLAQLGSHIDAARLLGAEGVRIPFGVVAWPLLVRAAALADAAGVMLFEEVQGPARPDDPRIAERVALLEGSDGVGVRLLVDVSALMTALPRSYLASLRANGVPADVVARLDEAFVGGVVAPVVLPHLGDPALSPDAKSLLVTAMTRFGHGRASEWSALAPWVGGIHLKFWDLQQAEEDLAHETGALLEMLFAGGFAGTVCSEWGGHEWESSDVPAVAQTAAHRRLFAARFPDVAGVPGTRIGR